VAAASRRSPESLIADRYRVLEQIGAGGMGVVWKAWDERLHRPVAIKQLHPERGMAKEEAERAVARAMREARITARLHHQHAVQIFDVVEQDGQPCLIMPYLPSTTLLAILRERGPMAPVEVARIGAEVASALAAAHAAGIVHRDVTPGNILITEEGSAKISDFGISHALGDPTVTSTGMVVGTPAYLAPEVARGGSTSPSSDVFSLGATLYTAVEGTPPFGTHENSMALLHRVASGEVTAPRRAGPLTPVLVRMLADVDEARPSMAEAAAALRDIADQVAAAVVDVPPVNRAAEVAAVANVVPTAAEQPRRAVDGAATELLPAPSARKDAEGNPPDEPPVPTLTRRSRRRQMMFALVGAATALLILLALFVSGLGDGPRAATPRLTPSPSPSGSSQPGPSSVPSTSATTPAPRTSRTVERPVATTPPPETATPTGSRLAEAIASYYRLVPGDTDAGWARLTRVYQTTTAVNRQYYDSFWSSVQRVSARDISATAPSTVVATLTYSMRDGRIIRERTSFGLVSDDGVLKINSSRVLSSRQP
jgi:serine/threonine protein kinase